MTTRPAPDGRPPDARRPHAPKLEAKIDGWIARQLEPRPSRSEAIRRLIEEGLEAGEGCTRRREGAKLFRPEADKRPARTRSRHVSKVGEALRALHFFASSRLRVRSVGGDGARPAEEDRGGGGGGLN